MRTSVTPALVTRTFAAPAFRGARRWLRASLLPTVLAGLLLCAVPAVDGTDEAEPRPPEAAATEPRPPEADVAAAIWDDPEFKKAFIGSYGIHPDIEPRVTPIERDLLMRIYPLVAKDPELALEQLRKTKRADSSPLFDFLIGNIHFQQDRLDAAAQGYETAVARFPSFRRAWRNLALIHVRRGRHAEAIGAFTRLVELGGGDGTTYGLLGYAHAAAQDWLAAESAYRSALLLQPDNSEWRLGLARCLFRQEKHEEAATLLDVLIEKHPDRPEFWLLQANAWLGLKQPLRAAENLEILARLGRADVEALNLLGDIYLNEGLPDLAAAAYRRGLDADPGQPPARALRAVEALAARGGMEQAKTLAARLRDTLGEALTEEDRRRLLRLEARIAVAGGDGGGAVRILEELVALDPLDGDALLALGQHHERAGDPEKAILFYERAGGLESHGVEARVRHARLLVRLSRYQEALPLLKRAQELQPRDDVARFLEQVERVARTAR
jgi:tetratricopeptide (TPR) repeat protein